MALDIDERGKLAGCQIVESSGSQRLDKAVCRMFAKSGRFKPAMKQGRAVRAVVPQRPRLMPEDYQPPFLSTPYDDGEQR